MTQKQLLIEACRMKHESFMHYMALMLSFIALIFSPNTVIQAIRHENHEM